VSAVTVHKLYPLDLGWVEREAERLRCETVWRDSRVMDLDYGLAMASAKLRAWYGVSMVTV
jgi:hypothetical protein